VAVAGLLISTQPGEGCGGAVALARWGASTLIEYVLSQVRAWPVDRVVVVLGAAAEQVLERADLGDVTVVIDPEWEEGVAASLRAGVDTIMRLGEFDAIVVGYGDQLHNPPEVVSQLLESHRSSGKLATVPKYRYAGGAPCVVGEGLWSRLMGLEGEATLEQLLQAHPDWVDEVWFDRLPPHRIVTPDDLLDVRRRT